MRTSAVTEQSPIYPRSTSDLLREAKTAHGDRCRRLKEAAIQQNMPLARSLAMRYSGKGIPADDLCQVAYLGLVRVIDRFDPDQGADFLSFALPTIKGELRRHFRDHGWAIRPTRRVQELQARVWAAESELSQRIQGTPSTRDIAGELDATEQEVQEAFAAGGCFNLESIDAPMSDEESNSVANRVGGFDPAYDGFETHEVLTDALRTLGERDQAIIWMRFVEELTQEQIALRVGVTQMQISRILTRIFRDLRRTIADAA